MTENENVSPGAETQIPAPEVETPEVTTPEVVETPETQTEDVPKDEQDDAQKAIKAMQRRIDKRTADLYRERAEKEQLAQRIADYEARLSGQGAESETAIDPRQVHQLAEQIAEVKSTTERSNKVAADGQKRFPDFNNALQAVMVEAGSLIHQSGLPTPLGEALLDCDDPAAMLHYLGTNPDDAATLRGLKPAQVGIRLARIEAAMKAPKEPKTSNAPKPITPVKSATRDDGGLRDDIPIDEWLKRRRAQLSAR